MPYKIWSSYNYEISGGGGGGVRVSEIAWYKLMVKKSNKFYFPYHIKKHDNW